MASFAGAGRGKKLSSMAITTNENNEEILCDGEMYGLHDDSTVQRWRWQPVCRFRVDIAHVVVLCDGVGKQRPIIVRYYGVVTPA
jgi:hypothetical protein